MGTSIRRGRVVVNDFPAIGKLPEYEREQAVRVFAVTGREMPRSAYEGGVCGQRFDLQAGEFELAHFLAFALVHPVVTVERAPAIPRCVARRKKR